LPWDHIDIGVQRKFLLAEREKALRGETTSDCRQGDCQQCGVCDFNTIQPRLYPNAPKRYAGGPAERFQGDEPAGRLVIVFAKTGRARFLGHLEMANVFARALRRSQIPVLYSKGYHPKPKMVFADTLPLGMESRCERLILKVPQGTDAEWAASRLKAQMPSGIDILEASLTDSGPADNGFVHYHAELAQAGLLSKEKLEAFHRADHFVICRKRSKGQLKKIDLKPMVKKLEAAGESGFELVVDARSDAVIRPADIMQHVLGLGPETIRLARVMKNGGGCPQPAAAGAATSPPGEH
jgi:radical SAM-linked protein